MGECCKWGEWFLFFYNRATKKRQNKFVSVCLRHERVRKERALLNKISLDLLCSFNGEELVLAFRTAHIAKRSAVSDIPSDEGDLIYCMLQYCCLEKSNQNNNEYCMHIGLDFC